MKTQIDVKFLEIKSKLEPPGLVQSNSSFSQVERKKNWIWILSIFAFKFSAILNFYEPSDVLKIQKGGVRETRRSSYFFWHKNIVFMFFEEKWRRVFPTIPTVNVYLKHLQGPQVLPCSSSVSNTPTDIKYWHSRATEESNQICLGHKWPWNKGPPSFF